MGALNAALTGLYQVWNSGCEPRGVWRHDELIGCDRQS
jgi:hypothetical protein